MRRGETPTNGLSPLHQVASRSAGSGREERFSGYAMPSSDIKGPRRGTRGQLGLRCNTVRFLILIKYARGKEPIVVYK
jgi:hypothetical protein